MSKALIALELLSVIRAIVSKTEADNPDADGPSKLEKAIEDIEIIVAGLGVAWDEIKPSVKRMIDACVAIFNRKGIFKRHPKPA